MVSNLPILSSDKSDRHRTSLTSIILQTLGGYALMNQNTTVEVTEAKMDHASVSVRVYLSPTF